MVKRYLSKFPKSGSRTLTSLIYKEHPQTFKSWETCYNSVRYYRGEKGKSARECLAKESIMKTTKFDLPGSSAAPSLSFMMPEGKTLVMSDIHIPYHDETALNVALSYGDKYKPDTILLNGDCIDFFAVSRWEKNPEERNLAKEIQSFRQFIIHLRNRYKKSRIIMKMGNHEDRWANYLWSKAPELCGCDFVSLEAIFDLNKYGVETVKSKQKIKFGKHLTAIHGHEIPNGSTPVNFARTLQTKLGVCTIAGHRHTTSEHTQKNADGVNITCWGLGCLCDMAPDYAIINGWNHGFATVELNKNDFDVHNMRIINGAAK
jgi:predicted phosphodiesterase